MTAQRDGPKAWRDPFDCTPPRENGVTRAVAKGKRRFNPSLVTGTLSHSPLRPTNTTAHLAAAATRAASEISASPHLATDAPTRKARDRPEILVRQDLNLRFGARLAPQVSRCATRSCPFICGPQPKFAPEMQSITSKLPLMPPFPLPTLPLTCPQSNRREP